MWEQLPEHAVHAARAQLTYPLEILKTIEERAVAQKVPIVPPEVAAFLYMTVRIAKPYNILEIGSGAAYSSLWMGAAMPKGAKLLGLDRDRNRSIMAEHHVLESGMHDAIEIRQIDAISEEGRALIAARAPYDLVFIDCEKRIYPQLWGMCSKLVSSKGVFIADNVLFRGRVGQGPSSGRNSTSIAALGEFLELAKQDQDYTTQVLPLGDGLLVATKED